MASLCPRTIGFPRTFPVLSLTHSRPPSVVPPSLDPIGWCPYSSSVCRRRIGERTEGVKCLCPWVYVGGWVMNLYPGVFNSDTGSGLSGGLIEDKRQTTTENPKVP